MQHKFTMTAFLLLQLKAFPNCKLCEATGKINCDVCKGMPTLPHVQMYIRMANGDICGCFFQCMYSPVAARCRGALR
jgi:hypothetical protein